MGMVTICFHSKCALIVAVKLKTKCRICVAYMLSCIQQKKVPYQ